jgi:hypothetical protein
MDNKLKCLCIVALLLSLTAISQSFGIVSTNSTNGVIFEVNNTNLAPNVPGHPLGTGERIQSVTYWANNSPILLMVIGHASTASQNLAMNLSIDNVSVEQTQLRPLGIGENTHAYISATIPQHANYSVNITNFHHYEWREYKILTGNVTTINETGGSGCTGNCSFDMLTINGVTKNNTADAYGQYINVSRGFKSIQTGISDSFFDFNFGQYFQTHVTDLTNGHYSQTQLNTNQIVMTVSNGTSTDVTITDNAVNMLINGTIYNFNTTHFDMGGSNLTNCGNCTFSGTDNTKINKTLTQSDTVIGNLIVNNSNNTYTVMSINGTETIINSSLKIRKNGLNAIVGINNTRAPFSDAMRQNSLGSLSFITNWDTDTDTRMNSSWPVWVFRIRQDGTNDDFQVVKSEDGATFKPYMTIDTSGNFKLGNLSNGMYIKEGTNGKQGVCTLVAGSCTVTTTSVTANSRIFYNYQAPCTTNIGVLYNAIRNPGSNFTINNTVGTNTCTVAYEIFEPS